MKREQPTHDTEAVSIQWFPGHMTRTKRQMEKCIRLVDAVAEIVDARVPVSSRNPVLHKLIQGKPRVILMNKSDMADPEQTKRWLQYYRSQNIPAIAVDCRSGKGLNNFIPLVREVLRDRIAVWESKGMVGRTIRVMVVGIPNVGKSSLINKLCRGGKAAVADRPGVTRENRWFTIGKGFEMLDTPGVLWPKFEDPVVGEHLAFTGAVKDEVVDTERLASRLLEALVPTYPKAVCERYRLEESFLPGRRGDEILEAIGKNRGMLMAGGVINTERAAAAVLDEFRSARLGRITLERVEE